MLANSLEFLCRKKIVCRKFYGEKLSSKNNVKSMMSLFECVIFSIHITLNTDNDNHQLNNCRADTEENIINPILIIINI